MLHLKENPTLKDFQNYIHNMEIERGFDKDPVFQKTLLLGEEIGELFKAIRKAENLKLDLNSKVGELKGELADVLIYLLSIANRYNVDLEEAFREKEEKNKQRIWK